jgi:hypothetical protein
VLDDELNEKLKAKATELKMLDNKIKRADKEL